MEDDRKERIIKEQYERALQDVRGFVIVIAAGHASPERQLFTRSHLKRFVDPKCQQSIRRDCGL